MEIVWDEDFIVLRWIYGARFGWTVFGMDRVVSYCVELAAGGIACSLVVSARDGFPGWTS